MTENQNDISNDEIMEDASASMTLNESAFVNKKALKRKLSTTGCDRKSSQHFNNPTWLKSDIKDVVSSFPNFFHLCSVALLLISGMVKFFCQW